MSIKSKTLSEKNKGRLLATLSALCYGTAPLCIELFFQSGGTTYTYTLIKNIAVIVMMSFAILITHQTIRIPVKRMLQLMVAGILGTGLVTLCLTESYKYLGGGVATTLHFMYPIFTALIYGLFLKRKIPVYKWILLVVVSLSIILFVDFSNGSANLFGILLAIVSGIFFAVFIVLSDEWKLGKENPFVMLFFMSVGGIFASCPALIISGDNLFSCSLVGLAFALITVVIDVIIGNTLFVMSTNYVDGTETAFFSVMEPVSSAILNSIFLAELLSVKSIIGIVIILGSIIVMTYFDSKYSKADVKPEKEN